MKSPGGDNLRVTMKRIVAACLLSVFSAPAIAAERTPADARRLLMGGKYAEAAELYAPSAAKDPLAALGLARCRAAEGKLDAAVKALCSAAGDHADLHAELARLALERGDYQTARTRSATALKLDKDHLLARWIQAELHRLAGRLDEAQRRYAGLIDHYNSHEIRRAESIRWIGLAAGRYAAWNRQSEEFRTLVNDLYPAALKLEPDYWPAHYEAGRLFLAKYNQADAARAFQAALEINPNAAEVHAAMARLAVAGRDVRQAAASADRALEINPGLLLAWLVKADLAWANFKPRRTLQLLEQKALPLNPASEETLGRLAACYLLLDKVSEPERSGRFTRLRDEVTDRNRLPGEFYFALAGALEQRNKQAEAIRFFRKAIDIMPRLLGPRSRLGLLYMRAGRESDARRQLRKAFDDDPFNIRVYNTLAVLDVLDSMKTIETEHVIIKCDGRRDALLGRYAAKHLETIYPELCRQFGYRPPDKPLLEIFNRAGGQDGRAWFSTRMIALPYLGIAAACSGPMVAMVSPNEPKLQAQFNWARVLKHEFVHVVTLQQTNFNIPHWYTEGLAVYSEGSPRPQLWNELLLQRVPDGDLFDLRTINHAFSRPQSGKDWQMAYCQAELYVEFMLRRFGSGSQRRLLAAYAEGLTTEEAIRRVFGISVEQFQREYVAYLEQVLAAMPRLKHPSQSSISQLLESHGEHPEDPDAAAELAYAYLRRKAGPEAQEAARLALKLHPKHQLATYVIARLRLEAGHTQQAVALLEECLDRHRPQPNVLNLLAALKLKAQQYQEAAELYALGQRLDTINPKWTKALARVYLLAENRQKLSEVLSRLAEADGDNLAVRKKLAEMALARRDYAAAANWANQAIHINVLDVDMHRIFAEALVNRHNYLRAIEEFEVAVELQPEQPYLRFALADAYVQAKQPAKAKAALETLLQTAPDYPGAQLMLKTLQETNQP